MVHSNNLAKLCFRLIPDAWKKGQTAEKIEKLSVNMWAGQGSGVKA